MPIAQSVPDTADHKIGRLSKPPSWLGRLVSWGPLPALVVLSLLLSVINPRFATFANVAAILDQAAIPIVVVMGLTFVVLMGSIDLSVEGIIGATSMVTALLALNDSNAHDLGLFAVLASVLLGTLLGSFNGIVHVALRVPSFMVTLGTWSIGLGIGAVLFGTRPPRLLDPYVRGLGLGSWAGLSRFTYVAALAVLVAVVVQRYTLLGRYAFAIGGGAEIARQSGVPVGRYKVAVFAMAGAFTGLAGAMTTIRTGVGAVDAGNGRLFGTIAAVVIGGTLLSGGRGGVGRSVIGVLLLVVLGNGMILVGISSYVQQAVQGLIIVLAVFVTMWRHRERMRVIK